MQSVFYYLPGKTAKNSNCFLSIKKWQAEYQRFQISFEVDLLERAGYYTKNLKTFGEYIKKYRVEHKLTAKQPAA